MLEFFLLRWINRPHDHVPYKTLVLLSINLTSIYQCEKSPLRESFRFLQDSTWNIPENILPPQSTCLTSDSLPRRMAQWVYIYCFREVLNKEVIWVDWFGATIGDGWLGVPTP